MSKKGKKVLISVALIMLLTFVCSINVYSDGGSSGAGSGGDGGAKACESCSCTYYDADTYGVRISLVYWENGSRVTAKSIDVFSSSELTGRAAALKGGVYTIANDNSAKYNRVEMITSVINTTGSPALTLTSWDNITKVHSSSLNWQANGVSFNYGNISSAISYDQLILTLYNVMQKEVDDYADSNYTDSNRLSVTYALFSALGVDFTKYTKEQLEGMHLMFEPIVTFAIKGTSNTASNYRLFYGTITQVAYAFQEYNCNSDDYQRWSMADSLLKGKFGIMLYAPNPCNTPGDMKYCTLNGWEPGTNVTGSGRNRREALTGVVGNHSGLKITRKQTSHGVGYIWLGSLNMPPEENCTSTVDYFNGLRSANTITQTEYDNYISQIRAGTLNYTDPSTGKVYKIETAQDFEFLIKENYDKFNSGNAACTNREKTSQDCEAAVDYINSSSEYPKGTQKYHDAIDQIENGTFTYELYDGTTVTIDKAYSYDMLKKEFYSRQGGVAACEDVSNMCFIYEGGTVDIDDCETGTTYFKDIEDEGAWLVCELAYTVGSQIYSSDNTGHDAVENAGSSGRGGVVGNVEYCEVFCYEEISTTFPTHVYDVKAGQTFTWGTPDGIFGTVNVKKTCKTQNYVKGQQGYRFEEWEEDYKESERSMIEHYMKKASYEKMKNNISTSSSGKYTACCNCCYTASCGTYADGSPCTYRTCPNNCQYRYKGTASASGTSHSYPNSYLGTVTGSVSLQSYSTGYSYTTSSAAQTAAKNGLLSKLDSLASGEANLYSQGLQNEQKLLDMLKECTNSMDYVYESTIQFVFKEPINSVYGANSRSFEFNDNLDVEETVNPDAAAQTSGCVQKTSYRYTCSGTGASATCTATVNKVWDCSANGVKWELNGVYTHKYPTQYFQWYTLKTDSTLVNEDKKGSEDEAFFYSVGFGLPTALSLTDGTYELKAIVYDIGDKAQINGGAPIYERPEDTHFDPLGLPVNTNLGTKKGFEYICTYEVDNEIFGYDCQYDDNGKLIYESPEYCDPDKDKDSEGSLLGIDITYRLVTLLSDGDTLDKAFPSREGDGREPGTNWKGMEEDIMYILRDDVYNEPAMYEIMLDVNAIQAIREDNQTYFDAGKDPYASYYDANNAQKVYCAVDGNEKYCASDFISDLYNGSGLNYRLLGTCLPTGNTLERAKYILENGCDTHYSYPTIDWAR